MKKNDILELTITDMTSNGEGIGKLDGFPFFIKDTITGDRVRVGITKLKKNYGFARLIEVLEPSSMRSDPPCPHHKACGGCQIMAMSYEEQLSFKRERVRNSLIRIGGFPPSFIDSILAPETQAHPGTPLRYRNKSQYPVGRDKSGRIITGYYAGRTHSIISSKDCLLGSGEDGKITGIIRDFMEEYGIPPYDETTGRGLVRHTLIRKAFHTDQIMVCLVINGKSLPHQEILITRLEGFVTSICLNINREATNVILGSKTLTIHGTPYIEDILCGIRFRISAQSFFQVNPIQTERLYAKALECAALTGTETVWDLYCGIGTISLVMAASARAVYGVEAVPQAIEDARMNASLNGISNAYFEAVNAEEAKLSDYPHPDVVVVDPPRKGCDEKCLQAILRAAPTRIVYVSCDPATLARDLKILCNGSTRDTASSGTIPYDSAHGAYRLVEATPYDLFPHTTHVETVVLIQRNDM